MKSLHVPCAGKDISSLSEAGDFLAKIPGHILDITPWSAYPYTPRVSFKIARADHHLLLQYHVRENTVKAEYTSPNDPVHLDSCVEFFIAPGDGSYFNLEVSCIGTVYMARGESRATSRPLPTDYSAKVLCQSSLGSGPFAEKPCPDPWIISLIVPLSLFEDTALAEPAGKSFRANFYKCGDDLTETHFISWNDIRTESPDFHRPEYFGIIIFDA